MNDKSTELDTEAEQIVNPWWNEVGSPSNADDRRSMKQWWLEFEQELLNVFSPKHQLSLTYHKKDLSLEQALDEMVGEPLSFFQTMRRMIQLSSRIEEGTIKQSKKLGDIVKKVAVNIAEDDKTFSVENPDDAEKNRNKREEEKLKSRKFVKPLDTESLMLSILYLRHLKKMRGMKTTFEKDIFSALSSIADFFLIPERNILDNNIEALETEINKFCLNEDNQEMVEKARSILAEILVKQEPLESDLQEVQSVDEAAMDPDVMLSYFLEYTPLGVEHEHKQIDELIKSYKTRVQELDDALPKIATLFFLRCCEQLLKTEESLETIQSQEDLIEKLRALNACHEFIDLREQFIRDDLPNYQLFPDAAPPEEAEERDGYVITELVSWAVYGLIEFGKAAFVACNIIEHQDTVAELRLRDAKSKIENKIEASINELRSDEEKDTNLDDLKTCPLDNLSSLLIGTIHLTRKVEYTIELLKSLKKQLENDPEVQSLVESKSHFKYCFISNGLMQKARCHRAIDKLSTELTELIKQDSTLQATKIEKTISLAETQASKFDRGFFGLFQHTKTTELEHLESALKTSKEGFTPNGKKN